MSKQTLAFDIDGVIVDFFGPFVAHINQLTGTQFRYDDCVCHNLAQAFNMTDEEMLEILRDYETPEIIAELPAIDKAIDSLCLLVGFYDIVIVTSRKYHHRDATKRWFERHFPHASIHYAVGRNNPFSGGNNRLHKPQMAEQIGALCLVEDNEQEFIYWDSNVVEPICFLQPWNGCLAETHPHFPRLDWDGILQRFLK